MKNVSLLLLGGGKRISLARRFINAANELGLELTVFSYEIDLQQPISLVARVIIGRKWSDASVEQDIHQTLINNNIDIMLSNVDPATIVHARLKDAHPAACYSSSLTAVSICQSKRDTQLFCESNGINAIPSASTEVFPFFAKPDKGSASQGAMIINNMAELNRHKDCYPDSIYQKPIVGNEYTVDAYVSGQGVICGISPRLRLVTQGGESIATETVCDSEIVSCSADFITKMGLVGPITLQFIREQRTGLLYLLEVNPRFGGGVIASIESGFDFPLMMIQERIGITPTPVYQGKKLVMKRYFQEAFYAIDS